MPSLKDIRTRISSVKSTQQITRAMKLVAAARMRKATEQALAARPYAVSLDSVLKRLAAEEVSHPLMETHSEIKKIAVVVVTSDRGLCGGFNAVLLRRAVDWLGRRSEEIELQAYGRKGRDFFRSRPWTVSKELVNRDPKLALDEARDLAGELNTSFLEGDVDEVWLAYNHFASVVTQKPEFLRLLPINAEGEGDPTDDMAAEAKAAGRDLPDADLLATSFVFEPDRDAILAQLLPLYLETRIFQVFLESNAGELAARMRAMDAATNNAGELIDKLTLQYNRARQAAITSELVEIISGAEAL